MRTTLSIVIPIYNEEETLPELWRRVSAVVAKLDATTEVIFVNDGSTDSSMIKLREIAKAHQNVRVLVLSRNFGHQRALTAGIDHASGDAVILMDGDLQDAPEAIPRFVEKWREGFEVVYAIREKRKENFLKRAGFAFFYRLQNALSNMPLPLDAGIFSLMDQSVVRELRRMPERNRYLSGLRAYAGFNQTGIVVEREARFSGAPRVRLRALARLAFDAIFAFSIVPLRLATWLGLACAASSFLIGTIGLYYKFVLNREFLSWAYGLTSTFFLGGVQLLALGIIGEYVGRIYEEVKQRPYYIVARRLGFENQEETKNDELRIANEEPAAIRHS